MSNRGNSSGSNRPEWLQQYDLIGKIGEGTYGLVCLAKIKSNRSKSIAIKKFKQSKDGDGVSPTAIREIMGFSWQGFNNATSPNILKDTLVSLRDSRIGNQQSTHDKSKIQHIQEECRMKSIKKSPTTLYEDSATCHVQIKEDYLKYQVKQLSQNIRLRMLKDTCQIEGEYYTCCTLFPLTKFFPLGFLTNVFNEAA